MKTPNPKLLARFSRAGRKEEPKMQHQVNIVVTIMSGNLKEGQMIRRTEVTHGAVSVDGAHDAVTRAVEQTVQWLDTQTEATLAPEESKIIAPPGGIVPVQ